MIILLNSLFSTVIVTWISSLILSKNIRRSPAPLPDWPSLSAQKYSAIKNLAGWAGIDVKKTFITASLLLIAGLIILGNWLVVPIFTSLVLVFGLLTLTKVKTRQKKFIKDLPDAIDAITKSLRAGYNLREAFSLVAGESRPPLKQALDAIPRAENFGLPHGQSLIKINQQVRLPEWDLLTQALLIHERNGGNLIPTLNNLAGAIRQNITINQEARVATAAGRISAMIITGTIPLLFLFLVFFNPSYLQIMFSSTLGQKLLIGAGILQILGFIIMKKISTVKN